MTEALERQIIQIVATDRIDIPISSMSGKLKRQKPKLAQQVAAEIAGRFSGDRTYARVQTSDVTEKARTMREAVDTFAEQYPRHGKILNGMIEEVRAAKETHLYFGMNDGARLSSDDYMSVMTGLGFSDTRAEGMYQELMQVSRNLSKTKARADEERSILVG
jgi:hypothetical protein